MSRHSLVPTSSARQSLAPSKPSSRRASTRNISDSMSTVSLGPRRSSVKSSGRQSIYGRTSNIMASPVVTKDPRPIREKVWQNQAIRTLIGALVQMNYPLPVSPKTLSCPSSKDFKSIFTFLYQTLDPHFVFEKKYEDQVQPILKGLRYPFADQISKSHLFSVGSLHAWPVLLAMLVWMVELIVCCEQLDSANDLESNTVVDQAAQAEKIFFDYLVKAYDVFLAGSDDYAAMDKTLNANFGTPFLTLDRKNKQVIKHVEKISKSCSVLERELATLSHAESPLVVVERERGILEADKEKFQNYLSHIKIKLEKLNDSVSALNDDMTSIEAEMEKLYAEKQELSETVDLQELSPADVDRMNSERDQLVQSLEAARTALDDINKRVWQSEITMQKTMDRLEKSVQDFNTGVYKLDISDKERFPGLVSELELSVQANSRKSMVSIDLLNVCKPSCTSYINAQRNGCHKINDETYALQEKVDTVSWAHLQKQEQVSILASSVECCNTRYQEQKQFIGKQLNLATQEFATLSRTIEKMKMESNQLVLSSSQKLGQVTAEHEKREVLRSASRDKMLNQVVNGLVEVFGFHQKIAGGLDEMKKVVFVEQGK